MQYMSPTSHDMLDANVAHHPADQFPYPPLAKALEDQDTFNESDIAQDNREMCEFVAHIMYALGQPLRMEIMTILMHTHTLQMNDLMLLMKKDRQCLRHHVLCLQNTGLLASEAKRNRYSITPLGKSWMKRLRLW